MHNVFISYHHDNDQIYKEELLKLNGVGENRIFVDGSVNTGDISDDLSDEEIREKIRDEYLRDTTVTIVIVGLETKGRKHIDWEIYSSMFDGTVNKKSGILVVKLPSTNCTLSIAAHANEKEIIHPEIRPEDWININSRVAYEQRYPYLSDRIIDNLLSNDVKISVVPWYKVNNNRGKLEFLIDGAFKDRVSCNYDLSRALKRQNS